jgi:hypothetical protein
MTELAELFGNGGTIFIALYRLKGSRAEVLEVTGKRRI